jgi:hypothetical protein
VHTWNESSTRSLMLLLLSLELHAKLIMKELKMGSMFGTRML